MKESDGWTLYYHLITLGFQQIGEQIFYVLTIEGVPCFLNYFVCKWGRCSDVDFAPTSAYNRYPDSSNDGSSQDLAKTQVDSDNERETQGVTNPKNVESAGAQRLLAAARQERHGLVGRRRV